MLYLLCPLRLELTVWLLERCYAFGEFLFTPLSTANNWTRQNDHDEQCNAREILSTIDLSRDLYRCFQPHACETARFLRAESVTFSRRSSFRVYLRLAVRCCHDGADWIARLFTMHNSHVSPRAAIKSVRADDLCARSTGREERKILPYATRVHDYNVSTHRVSPRRPPPNWIVFSSSSSAFFNFF